MATEVEIIEYAERLYTKLIDNFDPNKSPFALITRDDATYSDLPGIKSANIRNVLIGGHSSGTATLEEFVHARAQYDASCTKLTYLIESKTTPNAVFSHSKKISVDAVVEHLRVSTQIITQRIWKPEMQKKIRMEMESIKWNAFLQSDTGSVWSQTETKGDTNGTEFADT
jgi:hypothetical protein